MKIERVEAIAVRIPLAKVFSGSSYQVDTRATIITRIYTDTGLVSEVYNGDEREHGLEIAALIEGAMAPLLLGQSIFAHELLWEKLFQLTIGAANRPLVMNAIACVDTAIWDLKGKALGTSVCNLLGGYRQELPIIAIAGYYLPGKVPADLAPEMEWLKSVGMAGCKVKVGKASPEVDAERVKHARRGGGDDFLIAVDANRGWNVADATRFARLVEPYDIAWFEEPCHWHDDARGMAQVRRATSIPINAGQSEVSAAGVRRLLDAEAVDIVNFDASEGGGITEWRRAAAACGLVGVRMAHHEEPQIASHMLGALPHGICVECFPDPDRDPIFPGMWVNPPRIDRGILSIPQGPGFDIRLDWDMVQRYRIN
jgi:D-galactarolactone cycloisomerase